MSGQDIGIIIGILVGIIIIFLICRELVCWYWKINRLIALMEEQNNLFKQFLGLDINIKNKKTLSQTEYRGEKDIMLGGKWICGNCGTGNDSYLPNCQKCNKEQKI